MILDDLFATFCGVEQQYPEALGSPLETHHKGCLACRQMLAVLLRDNHFLGLSKLFSFNLVKIDPAGYLAAFIVLAIPYDPPTPG